jgi:hypothetical protein
VVFQKTYRMHRVKAQYRVQRAALCTLQVRPIISRQTLGLNTDLAPVSG